MDKKKHAGGRPPIYKSPEELEKRIIDYFKNGAFVSVGLTEDNLVKKYAPTLCGLILWLGFSCKDTFYEYGKKKEFSDSIKRARLMIEQMYESKLTGQYATGSIFALKNFGWKDEQYVNGKGLNAPIVISIRNQSGLLGPAEAAHISRVGSQV